MTKNVPPIDIIVRPLDKDPLSLDKVYRIRGSESSWTVAMGDKKFERVFATPETALKFINAHWFEDVELAELGRVRMPISDGSRRKTYLEGTKDVVPMTLPKGPLTRCVQYADGIFIAITGPHSYFFLSSEKAAAIPNSLGGAKQIFEWEEDFSIVKLAFPEVFTTCEMYEAELDLLAFHPDLYETYFGVLLAAGQSYSRDRQVALRDATAFDFMVISGSRHPEKWPDHTLCQAMSCDDINNGKANARNEDAVYFLVPTEHFHHIKDRQFSVFDGRLFARVLHRFTPEEVVIPLRHMSCPVEISPSQKGLARHALGLGRNHKVSYRNNFVAPKGTAQHDDWTKLVMAGYAVKHRERPAIFGGSDLFSLSRVGAEKVLLPGENLGPEDFPEHRPLQRKNAGLSMT